MILRLRKTYRRLTVDSLARRLRIGDNLPKAERVVAILDDMVRVLSIYSTRIRMENKKADGAVTVLIDTIGRSLCYLDAVCDSTPITFSSDRRVYHNHRKFYFSRGVGTFGKGRCAGYIVAGAFSGR